VQEINHFGSLDGMNTVNLIYLENQDMWMLTGFNCYD